MENDCHDDGWSPPTTMENAETSLSGSSTSHSPRHIPVENERNVSSLKHESLVSIHANAIRRILLHSETEGRTVPAASDPEIIRLEQRLSQIKRHRMKLWSELEEARISQEPPTVSDELSRIRRRKRPVDPTVHRAIQESLTERMVALRKRRRIMGSHRIAGISILPCPDKNVLGVRMDICHMGEYVERHFLFFDIVIQSSMELSQDDEQPRLRLAQHTVPSGVPLASIMRQTLGGLTASIPDGNLETVIDQLEECVGKIYDACFIHAVRNQQCVFLRDKMRDDLLLTTNFAIKNLVCSDSLESVQFTLFWRRTSGSSITVMSCHVSLSYNDPMSSKPTEVSVSKRDFGERHIIGNTQTPINGTWIVEDDSDSEDDSRLIELRTLFGAFPIKEAIHIFVKQ